MADADILAARSPRVFYGWWVLVALSAITFYLAGSFWWGFSVFFPHILEEFGWTRAQGALALTFQSLESSIAAPFLGYFVERIGARRLMVIGLSITGAGLILLSMVDSLFWYYAAFVLVAMGTSAGGGIVAQAIVVKWFIRQRGRATTALMVMPGLGATVIIPILTILIATYGWRPTMFGIGVGVWLLALPVLLTVRDSPESQGLQPDGGAKEGDDGSEGEDERGFTLREALHMRVFWFLAIAFALWNLAGNSVQPHLFVALLDMDLPQELAATVVAALPALTIIGRVGFGFLSDYVDKRYLLLAAGVSQAVGVGFLTVMVLRPGEILWAFLFLAFFSIGFGGYIPTRIVMIGQYFGRQYFGAVFGLIQGLSALGGMIGPVWAGWVFDTTGSYFIAFVMATVILVVATPLVMLSTNPQKTSASGPATPVAAH